MASIDQRPDGQWRARWREYPRGPQLARHFDRKRDAEDFLAQVRVDIARGAYLSPEQQRVTFGAYVAAHLGRQVWRPRTVDIARRVLEHWLEIFGNDRPLSAIRRAMSSAGS